MEGDSLMVFSENQAIDPAPASIVVVSDKSISYQKLRRATTGQQRAFVRFKVEESFTNSVGTPILQVGLTFANVPDASNPGAWASSAVTPIKTGGIAVADGWTSVTLQKNFFYDIPIPGTPGLVSSLSPNVAGYEFSYLMLTYWQPALLYAAADRFSTLGRVSAKVVFSQDEPWNSGRVPNAGKSY